MGGLVPREQIDEIIERTDLVELFGRYADVRRAGAVHKCCCPFHDERTPSLVIYPDQHYHCYGCGAHGGAIDLVMEKENISFIDTLEMLAQPLGIELRREGGGKERLARGERDRMRELMERTTALYEHFLWQHADGAAARQYLAERGLSEDTCRRYRLGWAPGKGRLVRAAEKAGFAPDMLGQLDLARQFDRGWTDRFYDRLMFPICDRFGYPIAFSGRLLPVAEAAAKAAGRGVGKYINSTDTPLYHKSHTVYNLHQARMHVRKHQRLMVMEGPTDVMAADQAGIAECVAVMGTAFTPEHARQLRQAAGADGGLMLLFDGDNAGRTQSVKAVTTCLAANCSSRVILLPAGADPSDLLAKGGDEGLARFSEVLSSPVQDIHHLVTSLAPRPYDLDQRQLWQVVDQILAPLKHIDDPALCASYLDQISRHFDQPFARLQARLATTVAESAYPSQASESAATAPHVVAPPPTLAEAERQVMAIMLRHNELRVTASDQLELEPQAFSEAWQGTIERLIAEPENTLAQLMPHLRLPGAWTAELLEMAQQAPEDPAHAEAALREAAPLMLAQQRDRRIKQLEADMRQAQASRDRGRCAELFAELTQLQRQRRQVLE